MIKVDIGFLIELLESYLITMANDKNSNMYLTDLIQLGAALRQVSVELVACSCIEIATIEYDAVYANKQPALA
jgi:hypothetical protein